MITQHPHTITFTTVTGGTEDSNGDWSGGSSSTVTKNCRAEINSRNGFVAAPDGTQIRYDWTVYMPLPQSTIAPGTSVEVKNGEEVLCKSTVKQFSAGQLNARVWL